MGRFPLQQDSAQVPRCGCKEQCELDKLKLLFVGSENEKAFSTLSMKRPPSTLAVDTGLVRGTQPNMSSFLLLLFALTVSFPPSSVC